MSFRPAPTRADESSGEPLEGAGQALEVALARPEPARGADEAGPRQVADDHARPFQPRARLGRVALWAEAHEPRLPGFGDHLAAGADELAAALGHLPCVRKASFAGLVGE